MSKLIPKSNNVWIFGAWYGNKYSDNTSYLFEYIHKEKLSVKAIWLSNNNEIISHLRSMGYRAFNKKSIYGFWYGSRAGATFINCGYDARGFKVVSGSFMLIVFRALDFLHSKH